MNIIVCIKQVPGTNKVNVDEKTGVLKRDGVDSKMNPYDLYAIESALRIKEKCGGKVTAITMGPPQAKEILYEAFSMGVDEGCLLTDRKFAGADVLATSYTISQGIKKLGVFDIIICGKQTTDGDTAQVGSEVSEFLSVPSLSNVVDITDIDNTGVTVKMETAFAVETSKVFFPCLISVDKDIFMPRLPSYIKKKTTKDREITILTLDSFEDKNEKNYGLAGSPTQVSRIFPPSSSVDREMWHGDGKELADKITVKLSEMKFI